MENRIFLEGIIREIVKRENRIYDVVYLHGDTGAASELLGKLEADYRSVNSGARILRITGEAFRGELLQAIQDGVLQHLITGYKKCDLFIMEGIQAVGGKEFAMEQLYYIFDHFLQSGVQMVISGSVPLSEMLGVEDRICAQLQGGICCAVHASSGKNG